MGNITQKWVDLLIPFSEKYHARLSASILTKKTNIPQQTASRYLNKLVALSLINYTKEGKNKLYYFDSKKQTTKIIFSLIENQKALYFQLKTKNVGINEILNYCEDLIIFGSYASGKYTKESDIDLVILGKSNKKEIEKIKQKQITEINEHYISHNEFLKLLKSENPLALEIMKNHILFGNISKLVNIFLKVNHE